ncbi:N-6 DNA methylase [bacterium]|nr:N-6 DNA methylase [bacterium]
MNNSSQQVEDLDHSVSQKLERQLWKSLDNIRGNSGVRFDEFYKATFGLVFLAFLNYQTSESNNDGSSGFELPQEATWDRLLSSSERDIGQVVNQAMISIERSNEKLHGISFSDYGRIDGRALYPLVLTLHDVSKTANENEWAEIFNFLLDKVARDSGKRSGEFSTPGEVTNLMIQLLDPSNGMTIYDPCAGTAGFLRAGVRYVENKDSDATNVRLFGQESNLETLSIGQMGLAINGRLDADLRSGNTLLDPQHIDHSGVAQFDRVISNPPFALKVRQGELEHDQHHRFRYGIAGRNADFAFIQHMIASLKPSGVMAVVTTHGVLFRGGREGEIRQRILEDDLVEAVIGLPPSIFYGTAISTAILVINKNKSPERVGKVLFINADKEFQKDGTRNVLRPENVQRIVSTFRDYSEIERFSAVATLDEIQANSFNLNIARYADSSPLAGLLNQFDESFEKRTIKDLSDEINSISKGKDFEDKPNTIYISRIGRKVTDCLEELEGKHDRYFQVVLKNNALNAYVSQFLGTSVGQHSLSLLVAGTTIQSLSKSELPECTIALPDLDTQQNIIETHGKLSSLKQAIDGIDREFSLNPKGLNEFRKQLDSMLEVVGELSEADRIRSIIRDDESRTVEFKETFSHDVRKGSKEKYIEESSLKTIVAFLNTDGGALLIGVADSKKVTGLDFEIKKYHKNSQDNFLLHVKNAMLKRIGAAYNPLIRYDLVEVDGLKVLVVECKPSASPCFMDKKIFYVRTNPATDKLEGTDQYEYIKAHFEN